MKYTLTGWFNTHYKRMQQIERVKFGRDLTFDRWDLEKWIIDNYYDEFTTLFKNWTLNNYNSDDVPSIDRLDDSKGYSFDNMRIVTWREDREKNMQLKNIKTWNK